MDMARMAGHGVRVFAHGVEYRSDRRIRQKTQFVGDIIWGAYRGKGNKRGVIRAFSPASLKRLRFVFANASIVLPSMGPLTYHAASKQWSDPARHKPMRQ